MSFWASFVIILKLSHLLSAFSEDLSVVQLVLFLKGHVAAGSKPSVDFGLFELDAAGYFVFIIRNIAEALPAANGLMGRVRGMVGAQLFYGEVFILSGVFVSDGVADGFDLCDAVEDVGDGLGELVKRDGV